MSPPGPPPGRAAARLRVLDALLGAAVLVLAFFCVQLLRRVGSLEEKLQSQRGEVVELTDRRLDAVRRTLERLATSSSKGRGGEDRLAARDSRRRAAEAAAGAEASPAQPAAAREGAGAPDGGGDSGAAAEAEESEGDEVEAHESAESKELAAVEPAPHLSRRRQMLEDLRARLQLIDADRDSRISVKEFDGDVADFLYFDRNASGSVTLSEIQRAVEVEQEALDRVLQGDRDGDGRLSKGEFRGSSRRFRYLDLNEDGLVTTEEYVLEHRRLSERLERDDMDSDRKISAAEFSGGAAKFEKYDANKDGFIDRGELKEMLLQGH
jgi:Ca2+-binding EF-hand superfamily protein